MIYSIIKKGKTGDSNKNQLKRLILFILTSLTVIQQMPIIKDLYYGQIRLVLYLVFSIFSVVSFLKINKFSKIYLVRGFVLTIVYTFLLYIVVKTFKRETYEILELIVPFGVLICSLNTNFNKKQLSNFLIWYVLLSLLLGISSIFYYGQGFTITSSYFLSDKNQIGTVIGISAIITGIWILNKNQFHLKHNSIIIRVCIFIVLIAIILIIRNRSGLLGVLVVALFAIKKENKFNVYKYKVVFIYVILIAIVLAFLLGLFDGVIDMFFRSVFENYNISDINSISAGRTNVYKKALGFVVNYPILGKLGTGEADFSIPHNYILNKWVDNGVLLTMPIIMLYLYLWYFVITELITSKNKFGYSLPIWILLFSLVVSTLEYTYPYGPGVSQLMVWFLLGQYFKHNNKVRNTIEE